MKYFKCKKTCFLHLYDCHLDFQSPVILISSVLMKLAEELKNSPYIF